MSLLTLSPEILWPGALQKAQDMSSAQPPQPSDLLSSLSQKQTADLFKERVAQLAAQEQLIPWLPNADEWIEKYFWIPESKNALIPEYKNGGPMMVPGYQKAALREALRRDAEGKFVYSTVIWSDIKKSGKSTLAAGVALWRAWGAPWGSVYLVANDLKQADSRVGYYMRRAIELNPVMRQIVKQRNYRLVLPNSAFIESIPIDPSGEAGSNADGVVFSELWGAHQQAQQRMWCLDDQTEILTDSGWKLGTEFQTSDRVAVYVDGKIVWEHPRSIFREHFSGVLDTYETRCFSLHCTQDHRLYGRYSPNGESESQNDYRGILRSNELRASKYGYYHPQQVPEAIEPFGKPLQDLHLPATKFKSAKTVSSLDMAAFWGMYLTEGSTSSYRGVPVKVRISQLRDPHPHKYDAMQEALVLAFGDWVKVDKRDGFRIHSTELANITSRYGGTWEKRIPRELLNSDRAHLERFLEFFTLGDGHVTKHGSRQYLVANKGLADDLQEVALRLGLRCSVRPSGQYSRVTIAGPTSGKITVSKQHWKEREYSGTVWCPSVSSGVFLARRNGVTFLTGNTEATLPPNKFGYSQRWVETYAGFTGESPLLEQMYEMGVKQGRQLTLPGAPSDLEVYANEAARLFVMWNTQPRLPWQSPEYYASEAAVLAPNEFQRVHRNQWVSSSEAFVPMEWWDACQITDASPVPPLTDRRSLVFAVDAGVSSDCFAVVGVERIKGSKKDKSEDKIIVRYAKAWYPPKGGKLDFELPETEIRRLHNKYRVLEWAYDQYQLHDMATRLRKKRVGWWNPFNQSATRFIADKNLYDLIRSGRLYHDGDPVLRDHVANANVEVKSEKMRLVKRAEYLKIDLTVALSMAAYEALRLNL